MGRFREHDLRCVCPLRFWGLVEVDTAGCTVGDLGSANGNLDEKVKVGRMKEGWKSIQFNTSFSCTLRTRFRYCSHGNQDPNRRKMKYHELVIFGLTLAEQQSSM